MRSWNRFFSQYLKDVKLWLFLVMYFLVFRSFFLLYFRDKIDSASGWRELTAVTLRGFRYDAKVVTSIMVLPFLFSVAAGLFGREKASDRFRNIYGSFLIVVFTITCAVTIGYFREYDDQFNHILFNLFYDDAGAIFSTIWSSYHPAIYLAIILITAAVIIAIKRRLLKDREKATDRITEYTHTLPRRIIAVFLILALFVLGARGTFGSARLKRQEAAITKDEFLNKIVVNPLYALQGAYHDYTRNHAIAGVDAFLPDKNVIKAAQSVFYSTEALKDLDAYMLKRAGGPKNKPPRHIFLLVMESYDAWPLLPKYASLGLTDNLKRIARNGLSFENFLPSGAQTMPSYSAILTSIPYTAVETNYQATARKAYPTALAETFKRLGYRTRLFYGGFLGWHRIGEFSRAQGFDEVYGAPHIGGATAKNEWGVEDEYLFSFAESKLDDSAPSFNLILTTSNHAPHNVDVEKKGFPLRRVPDDLAAVFDNTVSLHMLGHLWYTDRCVGDFVQKAEARLPRVLFAFTGDHYGRKFINAKPDAFERSAVPFILYGREVLKGISPPGTAPGSHIDIAPTLIELAAPKGFPYYSFGRNLLARETGRMGIGWWKVIGRDYIADLSSGQIYPLHDRALPKDVPEVSKLKTLINNYYGLAWLRVSQGSLVR